MCTFTWLCLQLKNSDSMYLYNTHFSLNAYVACCCCCCYFYVNCGCRPFKSAFFIDTDHESPTLRHIGRKRDQHQSVSMRKF